MTNNWGAILKICAEIHACQKAGLNTAALAMCYVAVDTMAYLHLPEGKEKQVSSDFIAWVDLYLKGHTNQPYKYRGKDVYGARCAFLHAHAFEVDFHDKYPDIFRFAYSDGGKHIFLTDVGQKPVVIIGLVSFINDVINAISDFLNQCGLDQNLRSRVERRLPNLLISVNI